MVIEKNSMKVLLKEEWLADSHLKRWNTINCYDKTNQCNCNNDENFVELCEQDSCVVGRIDTIICLKCNAIKDFKIIK